MISLTRRRLALIFVVIGLQTLGCGTLEYLRAGWFRRQVMHAPLAPSLEMPRARPQNGELIGVLEIPRLRVCDPIIEGDGDEELSRGVGHLADTPLPWEHGNVALAGHRDTVFRPLARIRAGDAIAIHAGGERYDYAVRDTRVVEPGDLSVLRDGPDPTLTLITCFPFRFIGPAPRRFVVRAERTATRPGHQQDCRDGRRNANPSR